MSAPETNPMRPDDPVEVLAFERDPMCLRLDTVVVSTGEEGGRDYVVLADTVLYPEGGGQPADHGTVGGVPVLDVRRDGGEIRHVLGGAAPTGTVVVELDWARRFDHMQQHTAQHLLTAVADTRFGWKTTAFHLGDHLSDIEVDAADVSPEQLAELEEAVAAEIRAARPVTAHRVDAAEYERLPVRSRGLPAGHTGSIRLVEIAAIDLNTCGGTHCGSTSELEALKLLGTEAVRGGARIFYVAGGRLRRRLGASHERHARLRELLGASDDELIAGVEARLQQLKDAHREVRDLEEALAVASAEGLASRAESVVVAHWPDRTLPFLQRVAREMSELAPERVVFLTCGAGEEGAFLVGAGGSCAVDVSAIGPRIAEVLGGRGGGSGRVFQGRATALSRRGDVEEVLAESHHHE